MSRISVKVVPASSRNVIVGWLGESLKIKVKAPPEKGKANAAVILLLAAVLGVNERSITIISGEASPVKVLEVQGLTEVEILSVLQSIVR